MTSLHPTPGVLEDHVRAQMKEVLWIYSAGYPGHRLRILARQGDDALGEPPQVHRDLIAIEPSHLSDRFLGMIEGGSKAADAPRLTIVVTIPRRSNPVEDKGDGPSWKPSGQAIGWLYRTWPLGYERLRYLHERRQEKRSRRHVWKPLPYAPAASLFAPAAPDGDQQPAILIAMHWLEIGGAEKLAFDCIDWARKLGYRVLVVTQQPSVARLESRLPPDVRFIRLDRYLSASQWGPFLERLVEAENIRLIHIHHCLGVYGALAHLRATSPWVTVMDSTHIVEYGDGGYPRVAGVWSNFIDHHHVISRKLAHLFRDTFHAGGKIRLGRMLPEGGTPHEARPVNLVAGRSSLRVAFVGRLYYQKRPVTVLLTMKAIADWARRNNVTVAFDFAGEGPFLDACQKLAGRLGLRETMTFHPARSDIPALLAKTDILLLPSSNEGLALVCYEAIEAGAIPVCTDVGAQGEVVPEALLVPRDPSKAVSRTVALIDRLWREQAFIDAQAAALRARYEALAADPTAERVITDIYADVLEKSQPQDAP